MRTTRIMRSQRRRRTIQTKRNNPFVRIIQILASLFLLSLFGAILLTTTTVAVTAGVFTYLTSDLPDFTELSRLGKDSDTTFETTKIYAWGEDEDGDGNSDPVVIYEIIDPFGGDRSWIPYTAIPTDFVNATISIEDSSFWENRGFDIQGIARAFYEYVIRGGNIQGGSSITQQVVKNNLIEESRRVVGNNVDFDDYRRKVEEIVLSSRISSVYTKEQIMEWYLNTNFYGNFAYGIEAAARVYYDKKAVDLTLAQAAMLSAIPQSPAYNPINNFEPAKSRQELVLHSMFREGYIDRGTLLAALKEDVTPKRTALETRFDIISPHFAIYVRDELERRFGRDNVMRGGLQVYTTLDLVWQRNAECVARAQVAQLSKIPIESILSEDELSKCDALSFLQPMPEWVDDIDHNVDNAAVVMIDPKSGEIRAMVGSIDYWDDDIDGRFNVATDGLRQPGSSFKPFTYLAALLEGYTAASMTLDVETDFGTPYDGIPYVPQNYDRAFNGPVRMRSALANSYNIPAVEAMTWTGVDTVIRIAHQLGITTLRDPNDYGLSLTLGGGEVKLIDMAYAYSVFANGGKMVGAAIPNDQQRLGFRTLDPVSILRVTTNRGEILYEYNEPEVKQVIPEAHAFIIADMMSDQLARCPSFGCPNSLEIPDGRPVAAKTGSTNGYRDAWTLGYTPQLVTGVWVGNTNNDEMIDAPGSLAAAPLWQALMGWALQDESPVGWQAPTGVIEKSVCQLNGMLPSRNCPTISEYFVQGTEPTVIDNMYQTFRINDDTGELATAATSPDKVREQLFIVYPDQAADWARETGKPQPPTSIDLSSSDSWVAGNVAILAPPPFDFVGGTITIRGNAKTQKDFAYWNLAIFPAGNPAAVVYIDQYVGDQREGGILGRFDTTTLNDGEHTLLLQVYDKANIVVEEFRIQVTVDNKPPTARILFPFDGQEVQVSDEWIVLQAQAQDDLAIDRVQFYIDGSTTPFAISTVPPYTEKWTIPDLGCHAYRVQAIDGAGNSTWSETTNVCAIE